MMKTKILDFINWYFEEDEIFFISSIDNKNGGTHNYYHNLSTFNNYLNSILKENKTRSLYFTFNTFKNKNDEDAIYNEKGYYSRCKLNVAKCKSFVFDFDEDDTEENLKDLLNYIGVEPSYVLNTSPNKFQVCYKLNMHSLEMNIFEAISKTISKKFKSDLTTNTIEKLFRLPYSINRKNDYETQMLHFNKNVNYDVDLFLEKLNLLISDDVDLKEFFINTRDEIKTKAPKKKKIKSTGNVAKKTKNKNIDSTNLKSNIIDIDKKLIGLYKVFLKRNQNDASLADIIYIKNRKKDVNDFDKIWNEIEIIRAKVKKPFQRNDIEYKQERYSNIFL